MPPDRAREEVRRNNSVWSGPTCRVMAMAEPMNASVPWLQPTVPPFTIGRMNRILRFAAGTCLLLLVAHGDPLFSQTTPERVWLAGRYDRTRVVVYFEAVKFDGTFPVDAASLAVPIADAFLEPKALPAGSVARFQQARDAERFTIGDRYDLL